MSENVLTTISDNFLFQKVKLGTWGSATLDLVLNYREELIEVIKWWELWIQVTTQVHDFSKWFSKRKQSITDYGFQEGQI